MTLYPADILLPAMSAINGMKQYQDYFGLKGGAGKTCEPTVELYSLPAN